MLFTVRPLYGDHKVQLGYGHFVQPRPSDFMLSLRSPLYRYTCCNSQYISESYRSGALVLDVSF